MARGLAAATLLACLAALSGRAQDPAIDAEGEVKAIGRAMRNLTVETKPPYAAIAHEEYTLADPSRPDYGELRAAGERKALDAALLRLKSDCRNFAPGWDLAGSHYEYPADFGPKSAGSYRQIVATAVQLCAPEAKTPPDGHDYVLLSMSDSYLLQFSAVVDELRTALSVACAKKGAEAKIIGDTRSIHGFRFKVATVLGVCRYRSAP